MDCASLRKAIGSQQVVHLQARYQLSSLPGKLVKQNVEISVGQNVFASSHGQVLVGLGMVLGWTAS
jgi:hypothetical protein